MIVQNTLHAIELAHIRQQIDNLLEIARTPSFSTQSAGSRKIVFEAKSRAGHEQITAALGRDGANTHMTGFTLRYRRNGKDVFKVCDITRKLCPTSSLKHRASLVDYLPIFISWQTIISHAPETSDRFGNQNLQAQSHYDHQWDRQKSILRHITRYIEAAACNSGITQLLRLRATYPVGEIPLSIALSQHGPQPPYSGQWRPAQAEREIIRYFGSQIAPACQLRFGKKENGYLRIHPLAPEEEMISPANLVETMRAMNDARFKGLSFNLED